MPQISSPTDWQETFDALTARDATSPLGAEDLDTLGEAACRRRRSRSGAGSLAEQLAGPQPPAVVDVRTEAEWESGHIEGSANVPLSRLQDNFGAAPAGPLVVHCASDYRASIAGSLLRREGFEDVTVLVGGIAAWEAASPEREGAVAT